MVVIVLDFQANGEKFETPLKHLGVYLKYGVPLRSEFERRWIVADTHGTNPPNPP